MSENFGTEWVVWQSTQSAACPPPGLFPEWTFPARGSASAWQLAQPAGVSFLA